MHVLEQHFPHSSESDWYFRKFSAFSRTLQKVRKRFQPSSERVASLGSQPLAGRREAALSELSKRREAFPDLAPILWHSYGSVAALLQEIVSTCARNGGGQSGSEQRGPSACFELRSAPNRAWSTPDGSSIAPKYLEALEAIHSSLVPPAPRGLFKRSNRSYSA